jgi:hypothetical protein
VGLVELQHTRTLVSLKTYLIGMLSLFLQPIDPFVSSVKQGVLFIVFTIPKVSLVSSTLHNLQVPFSPTCLSADVFQRGRPFLRQVHPVVIDATVLALSAVLALIIVVSFPPLYIKGVVDE